MMILVINAGSSSVKYQLFNLPGRNYIARGVVERIGEKKSFIRHDLKGRFFFNKTLPVVDHRRGINLVFPLLTDKKFGVIKDLTQIFCVGHRVVHGGEKFSRPCLINTEVIKRIKAYNKLAPLHNPSAILTIEACIRSLKGIPQVAVFDTAFHSTIPQRAFMYGLPYDFCKKLGIRRYGFHGTSHQYVALEAARILKKPLNKLKLITCHLGNGCSITATRFGKSVDTSMGFTPLEGLVMGTRAGDFDPSIIFFLLKNKYTPGDIDHILNHESGILGLSGISNDLRDIARAIKKKSMRAKLSMDVFIYRILKYIGAYIAVLGGLDALVFTAGIGENQKWIVKKICAQLKFMLEVTKAKVLIVKTNEEYMIARQAYDLIKNRS